MTLTENIEPKTCVGRPLAPVLGKDVKVPVFDSESRRYINLDNAATTPVLLSVWERVTESMQAYGSVHRGSGFKSRISTQALEDARASILEFCGGDPVLDLLLIGANTTTCVNHLARRLSFTSESVVLTSEFEHTSNSLPWRKHAQVLRFRSSDNGLPDIEHLSELLSKRRVDLVAVTAASNITGALVDVHRIARIAHEYGAKVFVDAAQLVAHRAIDRRSSDCPEHLDYVAFGAHKMYAPFGIGVLVGPKSAFVDGWPDQPGGGCVTYLENDSIIWAELPEREQGGTPNFPGLIALAAACESLRSLGYDAILEHEHELIASAAIAFAKVPSVEVFHPLDSGRHDYLPLFSFKVDRFDHELVSAYLAHEWAIGVRSGTLCQFELVESLLRIDRSNRDRYVEDLFSADRQLGYGIVRASCGLDTDCDDLTILGDALEALMLHGPRARYVRHSNGLLQPEENSPRLK